MARQSNDALVRSSDHQQSHLPSLSLQQCAHLFLLSKADVEATAAAAAAPVEADDDRAEEMVPAPGLLKNALAPVMDASATRLACNAPALTIVVVVLLLLSCSKTDSSQGQG